jgi:hypothetical protein
VTSEFYESQDFLLPQQARDAAAERLKRARGVKRVELLLKGDSLQGAKRFSDAILALRRGGARVSHEVTIRLEFPKAVSNRRAMALFDSLPHSRNGTVKIRLQLKPSPGPKP